MERDDKHSKGMALISYFNSHAHVERDYGIIFEVRNTEISTHTLTWSVTLAELAGVEYEEISTHTLTWSVTSPVLCGMLRRIISTHTLTWSVTKIGLCPIQFFAISTHTLTWSVTQILSRAETIKKFQLTRSRGA